jgi:hypothetical protein
MAPGLREHLRRALSARASPEDREAFACGWQARVEALLLGEATA